LQGSSTAAQISHLCDLLSQICAGSGEGARVLCASAGWEQLLFSRIDRNDAFTEDGGNFPFAQRGLEIQDLTSAEIESLLARAESAFKLDKMQSLVLAWDAVRALSKTPWASANLGRDRAELWLRALATWGGAMSWLGLFGHSSGAAVMCTLASRRIAANLDCAATKSGGPFAQHSLLGGLASTYFSLSKLVSTPAAQKVTRLRGIGYATAALNQAAGPRIRAGLLAVRGPLWLSARSPTGLLRGFRDLHESVRLHRSASHNAEADLGTAASRIQLGAAYKELAKETFRDPVSLRLAHWNLQSAYEALDSVPDNANAERSDPGQRLMCMKHLVETLVLMRKESKAHELWQQSMQCARLSGVADQLRQLQAIGTAAGWIQA
jgi:hypothetical protein